MAGKLGDNGSKRPISYLRHTAQARPIPSKYSSNLDCRAALHPVIAPFLTRRFACRVLAGGGAMLVPALGRGFGAETAAAEPRHAIAMHGEPALPAGFT